MKKYDLTEGKVSKVLLSLAIPIMTSSFLQFAYNLIDMIWVGGLGSSAVASIGSSSFYIGLGYSINALVVVGTGIKVAHAIGSKDDKKVKQYINAGLIINIVIASLFALFLILGSKSLIKFLSINNAEVENNACLYLIINAPILFFAFFNLLYARIFSSFGNNKIALKINAIGIIINIVLDPILIYGLKFGVAGAALATLTSNILMFIVFHFKAKGLFKYDKTEGFNVHYAKEICILGFPISSQRILFTIVNIILAKIIAKFGSDAIAAQKIGVQIESITFMVIGGLNGAMSSFAGQNFGAKKFDRIKDGYKTALKIGISYSIINAILFIVIPETLVRIFVREENTVMIAVGYLQAVAFSQIFSTIEMVSNGLFTGIGMPKIPSIISIVFTALRIPLSIIFVIPFGINGIWISIAISSILKGITAYLLYRVKVWKGLKYA